MKLEQYASFTSAERERLDALVEGPHRIFRSGETIVAEGRKADAIVLVKSGFVSRCKTLKNGSRQIMAFLIPGDLCDIEVVVLQAMDHDILAMTETTCVLIPTREIEALTSELSTITKALWWNTMTDAAVLRNKIIDQGRRDARERLAHLLYEMLIRYRIVGEATDNSYPLPITQVELADAIGISSVHVNRTLQQLRSEGLIKFEQEMLTVLDVGSLKEAAQFEANYLHLIRSENETDVSHRARDLL